MNKMKCYSTIDELINHIKTEDVSYRNLHIPVYIRYMDRDGSNSDTYVIPYKSVIMDYMPFLKRSAVTLPLGEEEQVKYRYKPKRMSNDLYGTPELWSALLELNNMVSLIDFTLEKPVKVFEPQQFRVLLNEVMILEDILR